MLRILLIDDEPLIGEALRRAVSPHGILLDAFTDLGLFLAAARTGEHAALVLDWNLRAAEGTALCLQLRRHGELRPIALLSGKLDADHARELAREAQADAFIPKPISAGDLVRALHSLAQLPKRAPLASGEYSLSSGANVTSFGLRPDTRHVVLRDHHIRLRATEFAIFRFLVARRGKDVSNEELIAQVLELPLPRTLDAKQGQLHLLHVHISRLRGKLGDVEIVRTVAGGYRIDAADLLAVANRREER